METLFQDLKHGLRLLAKSPGFSVIAILTLALGIGATTAIFSLIDAVLLKQLPVKDPQQLVLFTWDADREWPPNFGQTGADSRYSFSYPAFDEFRRENRVLSSVFAFVPLGFTPENTTVSVNGQATLANGMMVTGDYFAGLGVTPLAGRAIAEQDELPGAPRVAVISYAYWTRRFGRDPTVVGRSVTTNGLPFTIVGVTPPAFYGVQPGVEADLWMAFDDLPQLRPWSSKPAGGDSVYTAHNWICLNIMGRLKPGVTRKQAQAALDILFRHFLTEDWKPRRPQDVPGFTLTAASQGIPYLRDSLTQPLFVLMAAVGMVLLIACANVATLLLARASARQKEVSVRVAVGASRGRLVGQFLTESVLMAGLGGALGLLLAQEGTKMLLAVFATGGNTVLRVAPDPAILLFALGVSLLTGILFGLAPALRISRVDLASAMKATAASVTVGRDRHRLGRTLVVAQVAASMVLLVGAGLFVRTLVNYQRHNFGFEQDHLLTFGLDPTRDGYAGNRLAGFYAQLLNRVRQLPGTQSATIMEYAPFISWSNNSTIAIFGAPRNPSNPPLRYQTVGPDFFPTLRIPLVLGRGIQASDTAGSAKVAVVDETFVKMFLPRVNPIGQRFYFGGNTPLPESSFEIVGVAKPAELTDIHARLRPKAYLAYTQEPPALLGQMYFELRAAGDPRSLIPEVREAVAQLDPNLPLIDLKAQTDQLDQSLTQEKLFARLSSLFGLLAVTLAVIGLYGTLAYAVTRKTHEIGIRMALGAAPDEVCRMVVGQGLRLAGPGVAIGLVAALGLTRLAHSLMFGVSATDPATFAGIALLLAAVAAAASYLPARRAMRVAPVRALRYE
ncbi:MAG TPA: ABC transporter permease [Candidatus Acidoferrales bacterium]|nr:ABC transporter permease [Candidatus Acidoferrales bacterium]